MLILNLFSETKLPPLVTWTPMVQYTYVYVPIAQLMQVSICLICMFLCTSEKSAILLNQYKSHIEDIHLTQMGLSFVILENLSGGILKPTMASSNQPSSQNPEKLMSNDLDSSLANLVGSKSLQNYLINGYNLCFCAHNCHNLILISLISKLIYLIVPFPIISDLGIGNGTTKK